MKLKIPLHIFIVNLHFHFYSSFDTRSNSWDLATITRHLCSHLSYLKKKKMDWLITHSSTMNLLHMLYLVRNKRLPNSHLPSPTNLGFSEFHTVLNSWVSQFLFLVRCQALVLLNLFNGKSFLHCQTFIKSKRILRTSIFLFWPHLYLLYYCLILLHQLFWFDLCALWLHWKASWGSSRARLHLH